MELRTLVNPTQNMLRTRFAYLLSSLQRNGSSFNTPLLGKAQCRISRIQTAGGFLTVPENTGLILCSDGVQLFKSSNQAFWPILLAVTSLPPGIRMNAENLECGKVMLNHL